jgi:hypothetical protein
VNLFNVNRLSYNIYRFTLVTVKLQGDSSPVRSGEESHYHIELFHFLPDITDRFTKFYVIYSYNFFEILHVSKTGFRKIQIVAKQPFLLYISSLN